MTFVTPMKSTLKFDPGDLKSTLKSDPGDLKSTLAHSAHAFPPPTLTDLEANFVRVKSEMENCANQDADDDEILQFLLAQRRRLVDDIELLDAALDTV